MAVQICHDRRPSLGARDLDAGDDAGQAAAYRTYLAYTGRFSVPEPGVVVHHVEQALHPDQAGMDKRRSYSLADDVLTLRTQPIVSGGAAASSVLRWQRRGQLPAGFGGSP